ncbi:uncharacterized protein LOC143365167 [Halictus rubicundus]|uniref:uncharacterized protein LOC143365167 n=1 Tax=Halictus rubicundus TaxID=77578 RepID=UPI0040355302
MAAPMTELLFLFLLGIASWSCCVAEYTVTLTRSNCTLADGNGVLDSFECIHSDNLFDAKIYVTDSCPDVVQTTVEVLKDDILVNTVQQTHKQVPSYIRDLDICESVNGPDPDSDECSAAEGELSVENCDVTSFFKEMDPGKYDVNVEFSMDGVVIGTATAELRVEAP